MTTHSIPSRTTPLLPHGRRTRIALGVLSITPIAAGVLAFAGMFVPALMLPVSDSPDLGWQAGVLVIMAMVVVAGVSTVVAFVAFLVDVITNPAVPADNRVLWVLALLFGNVFAYAPYWYVVWWRGRPVSDAR
jgi:hypothetical protein